MYFCTSKVSKRYLPGRDVHALEASRIAIGAGDVSALVDEEGDELGVSVLARIEVQLLALLLQAPVFSHQRKLDEYTRLLSY